MNLFYNAGKEIKKVSVMLFYIGAAASVVYCVWMIGEEYVFKGIIHAVLGIFVSWFSSLLTYGFGQLIVNTDIIARTVNKDAFAEEHDEVEEEVE